MTPLRESLRVSIPFDTADVDSSQLDDPHTKARNLITTSPGLDEDEKRRLALLYDERFGDASITDFLNVFAGRLAKEAIQEKMKIHKDNAPIDNLPSVTNEGSVETPILHRRKVLWRRKSKTQK